LILILAIALLPPFGAALSACGDDPPDPEEVLERTLRADRLAAAIERPTVRVQSLGYEDRVLEERAVPVPEPVLRRLRRALAASNRGFREIATDLEYEGTAEVAGAESDHVAGRLEPDALAAAVGRAGGAAEGLGLPGSELERSLVEARFDLYSGAADGVLRRLDLTLSLDDPDNALPPTRIRFSLTGESQTPSPQP